MTPVEKLFETVEWTANDWSEGERDDAIPFATHSGILDLCGVKMRVHRLSDGKAIIDAEDLGKFLDAMGFEAE